MFPLKPGFYNVYSKNFSCTRVDLTGEYTFGYRCLDLRSAKAARSVYAKCYGTVHVRSK